MSLKDITSIAGSEFVFAILFVGLLWLVLLYFRNSMEQQRAIEIQREDQLIGLYEKQKQESLEREKELMRHQERLADHIEDISEALRDVKDGMRQLEDKVDRNMNEVWKVLTKTNNGE